MAINLESLDRSKPGVDEGSQLVLSGSSFEVTQVGNLEGEGPGEGHPLDNSEGTRIGNKLGISDGEVPGITLRFSERSKVWGDKG